ncbi:hypothetical protein A3750_01815 [Oleiphilus sp. HI0079]|uniref:phospholipase D family protein n=1 Tax=Oleiphilus sp. HI0079 TaxID=1822254 RepID=UPI0007C3FD81|nr:phospholipase D family protein [Oleiphilus sp. HI0079]KZZ14593.1 hypothetical protein A3750_01815 [Oleiphilus sp. HI0079]
MKVTLERKHISSLSKRSFIFWLLLCATALGGCALPALDKRAQSQAFPPSKSTQTGIGQSVTLLAEHLNKATDKLSGIVTLEDPVDAFVARALLAEASELSIDLQYYIWREDIAGKLLLRTLIRAADRGVRVRLLLDDHGSSGMDKTLATLDAHRHIEVRLFNPYSVRSFKSIDYLTDFQRINRRMHNKSFTVDNQISIVGGRNVANEYFGADNGIQFTDLDVLAIGPIVDHVSKDFDRYWSSISAYPIEQLVEASNKEDLRSLGMELESTVLSTEAKPFISAIKASPLLNDLQNQVLEPVFAKVNLVSDDPAKIFGPTPENGLLVQQLDQLLGSPQRSLTLISPYFVPGDTGVQLFRDLEEKGVEIKVLTNSLEANDVALVHSGYAKYRRPLLEAGVQLYELRKFGAIEATPQTRKTASIGSSEASLHAKTFAVDSNTLFVGSFNFDPRSLSLNTELGFLIESPQLAMALETKFDEQIKQAAYEVVLNENKDLEWIEHNGAETRRYEEEPNTSFYQRAVIGLFSFLPIEPLL